MVNKTTVLAKKVGNCLKKRKITLAVAESCTGGLLAAAITEIPGSSIYFECGFVVYSNEAKHKLLGVKNKTLKKFGAVSEETAKEMALGAIKYGYAKIAVAITGIAGPKGDTKDKPVGTVCFGFAWSKAPIKTVTKHFKGNRSLIREQAVQYALEALTEGAKSKSNCLLK